MVHLVPHYPVSESPRIEFRGRQLPWRQPGPWDLEPRTGGRIFESWVRQSHVRLLTGKRVVAVDKRNLRIVGITLSDGTQLSGKVFVDASYEGDLMARAGVSHTYGRESMAQYGEKLAGVREPHFVEDYSEEVYRTPGIEYMHHGQFGAEIPARDDAGKLLWGVEKGPLEPAGSADRRIQAYCYRLIATQRSDLKAPWPKPDHYYPERYELLLRYIRAHPGIAFARLVPTLVLRPAGGQPPFPVVVAVSQAGKEALLAHLGPEVEALLRAGMALCQPDLRGIGETAPDPRRG